MNNNTIEGLYDSAWYADYGKPKIILFNRNKEGIKKASIIKDFYPYIYCDKEEYEKKYKLLDVKSIVNVENVTIKKYLYDENRQIVKITLLNPNKVYETKKILQNCHEADIQFTNRYVIDNIDKIEDGKYRVNYFDIETTSEQGFPNYLNPIESVISIASFDNYLNKAFLWIWHKSYDKEVVEDVKEYQEGKKQDVVIRRFNNETEMLDDFLNFIQETQPDYLIAYNAQFDVNYSTARMEFLGLDINKLSPLYKNKDKIPLPLTKWMTGPSAVGKRIGRTGEDDKWMRIIGLQWFDILQGYKNIIAKEQPSWKLDYVAGVELGMSKLRTHFDIGAKWKEDPKFIEEYNYLDALLIKLLDDKRQIIKYFDNIKNSAFLYNINDVLSSGRVLDSYLLKKYKDEYVLPSKKFLGGGENVKVAGGFVKDSVAGLYDNVAVFDFSGFYPSIMNTFNLGGDVLIKDEIINCDPKTDEKETIEDIKDTMFTYDREKNYVTYNLRTTKFSSYVTIDLNKKGLITQSVNDLIKLRKKAKDEAKKYPYGSLEYEQAYSTQFSYKFLINAAYGVNAYPGFRLFNHTIANSITAFARMCSKYIANKMQAKGWKWIYSDTDSNFYVLHSQTLEENLKEIEEMQKYINLYIKEFVAKFLPEPYASQSTLKMDCEKIYKKLLLLDVKKRYIGLLKYYDGKETDKLNFMGLDLKKSNTIEICKKAQKDTAETILKEGNYVEIVKKYYQMLKESKNIDDFKIPSKLEKSQSEYKANTPSVRASLWSNKKLNTNFRAGTKYYIIWVKKTKEIDTDVIAFDDESQLKGLNYEIDKSKYIEDLYNKIDNLIRGIRLFKDINEGYYERFSNNNKSLAEFM